MALTNSGRISKRVQELEESQTLAMSARVKEMKRQGIDVIDLTVGEPDFITPENIRNSTKKAIDSGFTKYTETSGIPELKKAICEKFKNENNLEYSPNQVIVSCGAKHSLYLAFQAILNLGDEVIIPVPYWVSYSEQVKLAGGIPVFAKSKPLEFEVTAKSIEEKITPKTKVIFLNSPSNPTGTVIKREEIEKIAKLAVEKNILVISDEIYEHLVYNNDKSKTPISIASFGDQIKNITVIVNGVSKSYAMTGWRIGYTAGPEEIIKAMSKLQSQMTSNPSSISQMAALEALSGNQNSVEKMREEFEKRRDYLISRLKKIKGIKCAVPDGAFYAFPDISQIEKNSKLFSDKLLEKAHVAVVQGSAFGAEGFVRMSYATSMENLKEAMNRLEKFILDYKYIKHNR